MVSERGEAHNVECIPSSLAHQRPHGGRDSLRRGCHVAIAVPVL